jgi:hypothetical protein
MIEAVKNDAYLPITHVGKIGTNSYSLSSLISEAKDKGGHHRAFAHYKLNKPMPIIVHENFDYCSRCKFEIPDIAFNHNSITMRLIRKIQEPYFIMPKDLSFNDTARIHMELLPYEEKFLLFSGFEEHSIILPELTPLQKGKIEWARKNVPNISGKMLTIAYRC